VFSVGYGLGEQNPDVIVMQGINDVPALALADDEPELTQHPKLLGNGGLLHLNIPR
jgi:hypothetical protein